MKKTNLYIKTDITDWREEFLRHEPDIANEDSLIALVVDEGFQTGEVARMAIVARAMGAAPTDILKPNKLLLYAGGREQIGAIIKKQRITFEAPNGREYQVRAYVGLPHVPEERDGEDGNALDVKAIAGMDEKPMVTADSHAGLDRAVYYLLNTVPGHVFERLKVIATAGGDVGAAADDLKAKIDELAGRLTEPQPA